MYMLEITQVLKRIGNLWYIADIQGVGLKISKLNCLDFMASIYQAERKLSSSKVNIRKIDFSKCCDVKSYHKKIG